MKKAFVVVLLLVVLSSIGTVGCSNPGGKSDEEITLIRAYTHLRNNYESLLQTREAKKNKKITTFDFNVLTASVKGGSERIRETLDGSTSEEADTLRRVADDLVKLADEYSAEVNSGKEPDDELLKSRIAEGIEEVRIALGLKKSIEP